MAQIDKFHRYECLDRAFMLTEMVDRFLVSHEGLSPAESALADTAHDLLMRLWQALGEETLGGEETSEEVTPHIGEADLKREGAAVYLRKQHGITRTYGNLSSDASRGTGPKFYKVGKFPFYKISDLDAWAHKVKETSS